MAVTAYMQTGQHLTPGISMPDPTGTKYTSSGRATVTLRPDLLSNPNLPKDVRETTRITATPA
ncbi:MAG TPA: hypothetical protein VN428_08620 [Bryobacteraceae bacterium]|nr:hypothetical protein [Bryobacteraceae bacterium]